jgi:hypothetical protein
LHSTQGEKRPLQAVFANFSMGSDHQIYTESSFGIPAIYFNDWPDRYIHTTFDTSANIDPTKLKRAAFLGATIAYYLANLQDKNSEQLLQIIRSAAIKRAADLVRRSGNLSESERADALRYYMWSEQSIFESAAEYFALTEAMKRSSSATLKAIQSLAGSVPPPVKSSGDGAIVFERNSKLKGPMEAFGYGYLEDHLGKEKMNALKLLSFDGELADGSTYAYEALNFVDGKRTVQEITGMLSGAYGTVTLESVLEYLRALESIDVIHKL